MTFHSGYALRIIDIRTVLYSNSPLAGVFKTKKHIKTLYYRPIKSEKQAILSQM